MVFWWMRCPFSWFAGTFTLIPSRWLCSFAFVLVLRWFALILWWFAIDLHWFCTDLRWFANRSIFFQNLFQVRKSSKIVPKNDTKMIPKLCKTYSQIIEKGKGWAFERLGKGERLKSWERVNVWTVERLKGWERLAFERLAEHYAKHIPHPS